MKCSACDRPATHKDDEVPVCKAHLEDTGTFVDCTVCGKNMFEELRVGDTSNHFIPVRARVYNVDDEPCCWRCYEEACRI